MKLVLMSAAVLSAALVLGGCTTDPAPTPTTPTTPGTGAMNQSRAAPMTGMPVMTGCPDKDATHMVVTDAPVFAGPPGQGTVPVGVLKTGSKVLAMVPGSEFTKCTIDGGKAVYIKTAMLKPTTN